MKSCAPSFPENQVWSIRKSLFPQSYWTCISQNAACCVLQWDWGLFDVFCHDQTQRFDGELKSARVHSRSVSACVCLPVGVCTCDRAPHCCSDVSSLCLRPMTVTPSLTGPLLGKQGVWASPSLRSSISQPPVLLTPTFPSPNLHSGWNAESCCWPVAVVWWC